MSLYARFCLSCGRDFVASRPIVTDGWTPPVTPAPSVCPECWTDPKVRAAAARLDATIESILRTYGRR